MKGALPKTLASGCAANEYVRDLTFQEQRKIYIAARRAEGTPNNVQSIWPAADLGHDTRGSSQSAGAHSMLAQRHGTVHRRQGVHFKMSSLVVVAQHPPDE